MHFVLLGHTWDCLVSLLGAKREELVQKFVTRSSVGIFRKERTLSTPLDPKQMFWCISNYLGAFGAVWLPCKTRCKKYRTSAKVRAPKSRRNFFATNAPNPPHWTLNSAFGALHSVWVHLGLFCNCMKLSVKQGELV